MQITSQYADVVKMANQVMDSLKSDDMGDLGGPYIDKITDLLESNDKGGTSTFPVTPCSISSSISSES